MDCLKIAEDRNRLTFSVFLKAFGQFVLWFCHVINCGEFHKWLQLCRYNTVAQKY